MKMKFNEEIEFLKKNQTEIKLEMKTTVSQRPNHSEAQWGASAADGTEWKTLAGPKDEGEELEHSDSENVHSRRNTKETCKNSLDTTGRCNAPSPGVWGDLLDTTQLYLTPSIQCR